MAVVNNRACAFCQTDKIDVLNLGEMKTVGQYNVHYYCTLLTANISQSGADNEGLWGFMEVDIKGVLSKIRQRYCVYCSGPNANLKCFKNKCHMYFHLPCGLKNKATVQFSDVYATYCDKHSKSVEIKKGIKNTIQNQTCVICYQNFEAKVDLSTILIPNCCKTAIFHIDCLKNMALSAGYYMKCPTCNNKDTFLTCIKEHGVFVPKVDASWEREVGAYSNLLPIQKMCQAEVCLCTAGRCVQNDFAWSILSCNNCGGNGCHLACSCMNKVENSQSYYCNTCKSVEDRRSKNTATNAQGADSEDESTDEETAESTDSSDDDNAAMGKMLQAAANVVMIRVPKVDNTPLDENAPQAGPSTENCDRDKPPSDSSDEDEPPRKRSNKGKTRRSPRLREKRGNN